MDISPAAVAAADATSKTPLKVWIQVGRTHGLTEIGEARSPEDVPALLHEAAELMRTPRGATG